MKILPVFCVLTVCVLSLMPAFAAPPTVPSPVPSSQTILLQHITPEAVMTAMHWNQSTPNILPHIGTAYVEAQDKDNSLRVQGSPAVLKAVQTIVHALDIAPRTVSIKLQFFKTDQVIVLSSNFAFSPIPVTGQSDEATLYSTAVGQGAQTMQELLRVHHTPVLASPQILTTDKTTASIHIQDSYNGDLSFTGKPRINSDRSITLDMTLPVKDGKTGHCLETVGDGQTMVLISPVDAHNQVEIIFITPTLVGR